MPLPIRASQLRLLLRRRSSGAGVVVGRVFVSKSYVKHFETAEPW